MSPVNNDGGHFEFTESNVEKLKEKYSKEMRDSPNNPMKTCLKLLFDAVIEKDPIRRSGIAYELSKFLTKSDGIINLFLAVIDFDASSQKVTTHNQRFIAISNIISCLPKLCLSYENYCANIFKQLFPLLISDNAKYSNLSSLIINSLLDSPHANGKDIPSIVIAPLLDPIRPKSSAATSIKSHETLLAIHNLISNHVKVEYFVDIFPNLFYALVTLNDTPSNLKSILKSCLGAILSSLEPGVACCLLENTLFHCRHLLEHFEKYVEETGISIKVSEAEVMTDLVDNDVDETIVAILIHILEKSEEAHVLEFFFKFQESMWSARNEIDRRMSAALIEPLISQSIQEESTKLDLLTIIATNRTKSLELISRTLVNYVGFIRTHYETDRELTKRLINQSIGSCFSILEVLSVTLSEREDIDFMHRKCLPVLNDIENLMIENKQQDEEAFKNLESLLKKLREEKSTDNQKTLNDKCMSYQSEVEFQSIMKDLNDKLVPVRVHALVRLKQMVTTNDPYIVQRISQIHSVVESSLADDEPYVFLACINLLAEMSVRKTDELLPKMMELYARRDLGVQVRINIGEVLVRLIRQMNETAPYYAQQVLNTLYASCKDEEELIRMSSLTNIGEICRHLGDSLGKYIVETLAVIESVIDSDALPVKGAAIDLLRTMLMGLDKFKFESVQRELKSMYNFLKKLRVRTLDDNLCLQLDLALDEFDRIAREMLGNFKNRDNDNSENQVKNIKLMSLLS